MSATARTGLTLAVLLLAVGAMPDGMVYPGLRSLTIDRFGVDRVEASYFTLAPALGAIVGAFVLPRLGRGSSPVATLRNASLVESDETFFVNLSRSSGAAIAVSRGTGTIVNDDGLTAAAFAALAADETARPRSGRRR